MIKEIEVVLNNFISNSILSKTSINSNYFINKFDYKNEKILKIHGKLGPTYCCVRNI